MEQNIKPNFIAKRLLVDDAALMKTAPTLDCFDLSRTDDNFFVRVHGIKTVFHLPEKRQTMVVQSIVDDVPLNSLVRSTDHTHARFAGDLRDIRYICESDGDMTADKKKSFNTFLESVTVKQLMVFTPDDLYQKFKYTMHQSEIINNEPLTKVANDFMNSDLYQQRGRLMTLIIGSTTQEHRYIVNLLYELLGMGYNGVGPAPEQAELLTSFPWSIRCYFSVIMNQSAEYTKSLTSEFDPKKIPYEQRICLMKTSDEVKNKAMAKLKEVRSKNEDTGSKARTYLDGILEIPFGEFRHEEILDTAKKCVADFQGLVEILRANDVSCELGDASTTIGVMSNMRVVSEKISQMKQERMDALKGGVVGKSAKATLLKRLAEMKSLCETCPDEVCIDIVVDSKMTKPQIVAYIEKIVDGCEHEIGLLDHLLSHFVPKFSPGVSNETLLAIDTAHHNMMQGYEEISTYTDGVRSALDKSVVGHDKAKRQIERVIAQWMNGENGGYVFGFEGPPGVGKTSLAKYGISQCLTNAAGEPRPFAFIGVGGSANGSTFEGHNYTYVGATWGRIVSILMDTKISNPIIFIDEVDKISRTEHGRELIGILTHLVDPTQNCAFHDKYFSGVDIDLSKVLFVFSYNDVSMIDRILLDRIHRVRFDSLDEDEKVEIVKTQMLPELLAKFNLVDSIEIPDEIIRFLVQEYTCEAGVRKLKEILYEIVSELNLSTLEHKSDHRMVGSKIILTKEMLQEDLLKERHTVREKMAHDEPLVGVINGMWANAMGQGGILPIESSLFPSAGPMELKLTGMQGDVMKESMSVAKTLAWSLLTDDQKTACMERMNGEVFKHGIHIHCPEGAVPKDGPSAGTAITVVMYSLMTGRKIKNKLSITGEMCLQGKVTAIGGLDLKILGAVRAGVKEVLFPKENEKDYDEFMEKYSGMPGVSDVKFHIVEDIKEVLDLVFV
jgi:ATP-dependent Lon protease